MSLWSWLRLSSAVAVVGCGMRWGWRPVGVGCGRVGGNGRFGCVEECGCEAVNCWSGGSGVGTLAASGACVRARCFLGGVGVPLSVSCACPLLVGGGLCCDVGGRLFPLGVGLGWCPV